MRFLRLLVAVAALLAALAAVVRADDPDTEVARRAFRDGSEQYAAGRYEEAIASFRKGAQARPSPAFDYNIGRAYDRMGRWDDAIVFYQRALDAEPSSSDAPDLHARIAELRA